MKKSNETQLAYIRLNLLKLPVRITTILGWESADLFSLSTPMRGRFSAESKEQFIDYLCRNLSEHIEKKENEIDFSERSERLRWMFKIN